MLNLYNCTAALPSPQVDLLAENLPPGIVWIDMISATEEERAFVKRVTGLSLPSEHDIAEIESSSRLRTEEGALYLNVSLVTRSQFGTAVMTPVGFVLTRELMITLRFAPLTAFSTFIQHTSNNRTGRAPAHPSSAAAFVGLIEAVIDRLADVLENVGTELDGVSQRIFRTEPDTQPRRRPAREHADLRRMLRQIGASGDLVSKIRDSLLGLGRITPYVATLTAEWFPPDLRPRLRTLRQDIQSLNDYDAHLSNKVQLLLDATLGLINVEQNNIIKVLTVVSVVGVPPTLVASVYGMNFQHMPELAWSWGYPYGLALIALSAIIPLAWFKLRGWL
jgi:magnesium transporter